MNIRGRYAINTTYEMISFFEIETQLTNATDCDDLIEAVLLFKKLLEIPAESTTTKEDAGSRK